MFLEQELVRQDDENGFDLEGNVDLMELVRWHKEGELEGNAN